MMSRQFEDSPYRCLAILRRRRASRPDATEIRFVLDYEAWERAEPGTDRDEIAYFSRPPHLMLENAAEWARWDLPIRAMIETLSTRFPVISATDSTMPRLVPDFFLERHHWDNTQYHHAEQHLQRYLLVVRQLGELEETSARIFAEQLAPDDAEWVLLTVREARLWLVHLLQSVVTRLLPPRSLRAIGSARPAALDNLQN